MEKKYDVIYDAANGIDKALGGARSDKFNDSEFIIRGTGAFATDVVRLQIDLYHDELWAPMINPTTGAPYEFSSAFAMEYVSKSRVRVRVDPTGVGASSDLLVVRV